MKKEIINIEVSNLHDLIYGNQPIQIDTENEGLVTAVKTTLDNGDIYLAILTSSADRINFVDKRVVFECVEFRYNPTFDHWDRTGSGAFTNGIVIDDNDKVNPTTGELLSPDADQTEAIGNFTFWYNAVGKQAIVQPLVGEIQKRIDEFYVQKEEVGDV